MTEFYFVRHGETFVNQRHAFNGGLVDEPLTKKGIAQAHAAGASLSDVHFVQALSSSMPRAVNTAKIVLAENHFQTPLVEADGLRELKLGVWDGKTEAEVPHKEVLPIYFNDPVLFDQNYAAMLNIEPYHQLVTRTTAVMRATFAAHPSGNVLVVAHGLVFQFLLYTLLGVPFAELRQPAMLHNASISQLHTKDGQHFEKVQWDVQPKLKGNL